MASNAIVPVNVNKSLEKKQSEITGAGIVPVADKNLNKEKFVQTLSTYFKDYEPGFAQRASKVIKGQNKNEIKSFFLDNYSEFTQLNIDFLSSDQFKGKREIVMQWFNIPDSFVPDPSVNLFYVDDYGTCLDKKGVFSFEVIHKNQVDIKEKFILSGISNFPTYVINSSVSSTCMDKIDFSSMYDNAQKALLKYPDYDLRLQGQNCGHNFYVLEKRSSAVKTMKLEKIVADGEEVLFVDDVRAQKASQDEDNVEQAQKEPSKDDYKIILVKKASNKLLEPEIEHFHYGQSMLKLGNTVQEMDRISFVFDNLLQPDFTGNSMGIIIPLSDLDSVKQPSISDAKGMWFLHIFKEN